MPNEVLSSTERSGMAGWTGLEPATSAVTGRCSNQVELPAHDIRGANIISKALIFGKYPQ